MKEEIKYKYTVRSKVKETPDVSTLKLVLSGGSVPDFISGQYINIYFPESGAPEGKAYSISNTPGEETMDLTVKAMGEFSNRLISLQEGEVVTGSLPYGYFYSESAETTLILIAAGIGVTPFRSIIKDALKKNAKRKIILLYSNKTERDIVFRKEFDDLQLKHQTLKVLYFITREEVGKDMIKGRIEADSLRPCLEKGAEYMICGGISFTRDIWRLLKGLRVGEENIYTEAFFSH